MKKLTSIFLLVILIQFTASSQSCLPNGITFNTQVEIDNFQNNYPNCTEIQGDVIILGYSDITNLNGLSVLTNIQGELKIWECDALVSLSGLDNLTSIGGNLKSYHTTTLVDLTGLDNLTSVGGDLDIYINQDLVSLTGLDNLTSIGGDLIIKSNGVLSSLVNLNNVISIGGDVYIWNTHALLSIDGLDNVTYLGGGLNIYGCDSLKSLGGFNNITSFQGSVAVYNNPVFENLTALSNVTYIGGDLYLWNLDVLSSLSGLDNLTFIGGACRISDIPYLSSLSNLNNVTYTGGQVVIYRLDSLPDLTGLHNLDSIGGSFLISTNNLLKDLTGLDNIISIGGNLRIYDNDDLNSLSGLDNLAFVGSDLRIEKNWDLDSLTGLDNLTAIGGDMLISDNYPLPNLTGLDKLDFIGGDLIIEENSPLENLTALKNLKSINGSITIYMNNSLTSLSGLENVNVGTIKDLTIENNYSLSFCDVKSICRYLSNPTGKISIKFNTSGCSNKNQVMDSCSSCAAAGILFSSQAEVESFQNDYPLCDKIVGDITISGQNINNLNGLNVINSTGGNLKILNNSFLLNLYGLDSILSIGGELKIEANPVLTSLSGLKNIEANSITDLSIMNNVSLSDCKVTSICNYLASPNGTVSINSNNIGCNSQTEAETKCETYSISGKLVYDDTLSPHQQINNTLLILNNTNGITVDSVTSNQGGEFRFKNIEDGIYNIQVQCTKPWGGNNTLDALSIMNHFAKLYTLKNLRLDAADVDLSGGVNSLDALYVAQRFALFINSFPAGDWIFESDTITVNGTDVVYDFKGLSFGDVNGSYICQPSQANAGPDTLNILGDSITLIANTPIYGNGLWSIHSGYGGSFDDSSNPTTIFHGLPGYTYQLVWAITSICGSSLDTVNIGFYVQPLICGSSFVDYRDGNNYTTFQYGIQCWMEENLAYLPFVNFPNTGSSTTPYYYVYGYQGNSVSAAKATSHYQTYGVLYNWPAAMAGQASSNSKPSGIQGVCPNGWHIPGDEEWKIHEGYADTHYGYPHYEWNKTGFRGNDAGGNMKESGTTYWSFPNTGATNNSGFTALPGGLLYHTGSFGLSQYDAYFWSATEWNIWSAWNRHISYDNEEIDKNTKLKSYGMSVRCIKD